jgi:prepilin-type N-terminal cleavage/methylation domain-containing protein
LVKATRRGFSLIEVMIALAILVIIIASTLSLLASAYSSVRDSEMRGIAKNIAMYTMEYIRSRNVTSDNLLGHSLGELGNDGSHSLPGLVDLWDTPLRPHGNDTTTTININPASPNQTYQDKPKAFYYSLQGYVSLGDFTNLTPTQPHPCQEDPNLEICPYYTLVNGVLEHHYHTMIGYNHIVMKFPFTKDMPEAIRSFTALPGYIPRIYTTDTNKVTKSSLEYNPFYTNNPSLKKHTMAYRGFRILTTIVARKKDSAATHVQYYDVKIIVLWIAGKQEHSYTLSSRVVTYGGH